ncbi:MAG: hypothetical protein LBG06_00295 [Deltaproteobacteria bacterium]|jgi:hypothetical protein|nr:hypothetical protein [Deltaproteobacteria bacterium]
MTAEDGSGAGLGARGKPPEGAGGAARPAPADAGEGPAKAEAGVDWFFVLTAPVTRLRDKMMILEADGLSFAPAFRARADGEAFLARLAPPEEYSVQAMHVLDIREFAGSEKLAALVLDAGGRILGALAGEIPGGGPRTGG